MPTSHHANNEPVINPITSLCVWVILKSKNLFKGSVTLRNSSVHTYTYMVNHT